MDYCELVLTISSLACWMAEDKTTEELAQLISIYLLLAHTLETIVIQKQYCSKKPESDETEIFL